MKRKCVVLLILLSLFVYGASADTHTRDTVRLAYAEMYSRISDSPFETAPSVTYPYSEGKLTQEAVDSAVGYVNFMRYLAYLNSDISVDRLYSLRAQCAATLLAANDELLHDAPIAKDMDADFYESAHMGTMSSNIACLNWMEDNILLTSIEYFARDDGLNNLSELGHRRWLLNPYMSSTGFGLANSKTGLSYAVMYAHDTGNDDAEFSEVMWPSEGAFPAELMETDTAWSISLNGDIYGRDYDNVAVTISEKTHGSIDISYMEVNVENYGMGDCLIFLPDLSSANILSYQQNQEWTVKVTGLKEDIEYTVNMISLEPISPVSVEVSPLSLTLCSGDRAKISANVIPEWADDTSVKFSSDNENVAVVDRYGWVTANNMGECVIEAISANGKLDKCHITVIP